MSETLGEFLKDVQAIKKICDISELQFEKIIDELIDKEKGVIEKVLLLLSEIRGLARAKAIELNG